MESRNATRKTTTVPAELLSRSFQDGSIARPAGRRRQLPAGVETHQAIRLLAFQSRSDDDGLPNSFDAARQSVDFCIAGWPHHAKGFGVHGAIHRRQEELAFETRCDVRQRMAHAAEQSAVRGTG